MTENILNIEKIRNCIYSRKISWTKHCLNRMNQRNIFISDIKQSILNGKIIEHYNLDYPYPSCLILGRTKSNKYIHIVCGIDNDTLYMITVYYPDKDKWENRMEKRRRE